MPVASRESRRVTSLLGERKASSVVMVAVLFVAFACAIVGFVVHTVWVAAIIVLALGLGYAIANVRRIAEQDRTLHQ